MLKKLGFDWDTPYYYDAFSKDHNFCFNGVLENHNCFNDETSAPVLYVAKRWLREKHNIVVKTWCNASGYNCDVCKTNGTSIKNFEYCENSNDGGMFDKYKEALMNALKWACRYLIKTK